MLILLTRLENGVYQSLHKRDIYSITFSDSRGLSWNGWRLNGVIHTRPYLQEAPLALGHDAIVFRGNLSAETRNWNSRIETRFEVKQSEPRMKVSGKVPDVGHKKF